MTPKLSLPSEALREKVTVEGRIAFCIQIKVSDMRDWPAERIDAFFQGLALAISAVNCEGVKATDLLVEG